jgi:group I intron endonuclease
MKVSPKFCVYAIKSTTTGKAYYGSTHNFTRRCSQHLQMLRRGNHHSIHLQNAWNLYKESDFVIEVLQFFDAESDMLACEKAFLVNIKSTYNVSTEVDKGHTRGRPRSAATKAKLSAMFKGKVVSEETKERIRAARAKQGATRAGVPHTEETKVLIREKRKLQTNIRKGHKASADLRKKLSLAKLGKNYPRVKVVTPDGIFVGVDKAAKHFGVHVATVRYRVKNRMAGWTYESL